MNSIEIVENQLVIKDEVIKTYKYLKLLFFVNLISSFSFIYKKSELDILFIFTGVISIIGLIKMYFFDYTASKIPIQEIKKYRETHVFDNYKIILELYNGKKRELKWFKNQDEFQKCIDKIEEAGIQKHKKI